MQSMNKRYEQNGNKNQHCNIKDITEARVGQVSLKTVHVYYLGQLFPMVQRLKQKWNECYDNEDELQSFRHKARQQDKVYEEREESCWILHLRTGIFYPKGHEGVMNEVPDGAAIFASSYWLRNSDMYRV
ncbi:hypothetical protein Tco_0278330 [Tanacetum coccineum]